MSTCCRTCEHRNSAVKAWPSPPTQLEVCVITLVFESPISQRHTDSYIALNTLFNNIGDSVEASTHPSTFTAWSPCLSDPRTAVIVTTVREVCNAATSPIFGDVRQFLAKPPSVQHVYLDLAVVSLAASSPEQRVSCDIMQVQAPSPEVAAAVGKLFGWDPKRSSISSQLHRCAPAAFSRPGDLIRDFWAWADLPKESIMPFSLSTGSHEALPTSPPLINTNSDAKNMSLPFLEEVDEPPPYTDDETLVMIFQWSSRADGERFKDHERMSYGPNGEEVRKDLWDRQVAHPVGRLQSIGAKIETYRLELRAVEPRVSNNEVNASSKPATRGRNGSRRLSVIASGFGEKVSGLWR